MGRGLIGFGGFLWILFPIPGLPVPIPELVEGKLGFPFEDLLHFPY